MSVEKRGGEPQTEGLRNYILTFRTVNGDVIAWCVRTNTGPEEIPKLIESAANEWLLSPAGHKFVDDEDLADWGFDYWHALDHIPDEILSKHNIFPWVPIEGVVELDPDDNLLPDELRQPHRGPRRP
jgi:hypothetical protein